MATSRSDDTMERGSEQGGGFARKESNNSNGNEGCISRLEDRLSSESDQLEELHMEAAIDAELEGVSEKGKGDHNSFPSPTSNPHSVANCLSPFVPTSSEKIQAFVDWVALTSDDILLDIGCGDGRVCIAAAKLCGCRTIGIDVSPLCINRANVIAKEEGLEDLCLFYQTDATVDPEVLLQEQERGKNFMAV